MKQEEKSLHEKLEQLTSEHTAVEEAMQRALGYVEEGGAKIKNALAKQDVMEVEAGYKLVESGKDKQSEGTSKISRIMDERNKVERELLSLKKLKSQRIVVVEHLTAIDYCYCSNSSLSDSLYVYSVQ